MQIVCTYVCAYVCPTADTTTYVRHWWPLPSQSVANSLVQWQLALHLLGGGGLLDCDPLIDMGRVVVHGDLYNNPGSEVANI